MKQEKGNIYNIAHKKMFRGWNLVILDSGEEILMRRNLSISKKKFYTAYKSTIPLREYLAVSDDLKGNLKRSSVGIFVAIISASIVRNFVPRSYIIGNVNFPFSFQNAIVNLFIVIIVLFLFFNLLCFYRYNRLKKFIESQNGTLMMIGKIRNNKSYRTSPDGREYW
ncbi:hypothetical protein GKS17_01405 [Streptococcus uberis]|uniref:hypothetical protein n=2 Tax=Streptococcus uberis TaxID=1349 RepID=UPI0012B60CA4|nr:hypothetical protein [Streptococcus uberis]MTC89760.1 hypothetical protein [Streptococcus uberis]MTC95455.1 hypothetical protein [Streptococcus uberis]